MKGLHADERGIILASLLKAVLVLALVGLVVVEAGSIFFTKLRIQDSADAAAIVGADQLSTSGDPQLARQQVIEALRLRDPEMRLRKFEASPDGTVRVTVRKVAPTILVHRFDFSEDWGIIDAEARGRPVSPDV
ncbi:MAG: pilus assembly protein TadG-related protein [Actinomycetota bacterium]